MIVDDELPTVDDELPFPEGFQEGDGEDAEAVVDAPRSLLEEKMEASSLTVKWKMLRSKMGDSFGSKATLMLTMAFSAPAFPVRSLATISNRKADGNCPREEAMVTIPVFWFTANFPASLPEPMK